MGLDMKKEGTEWGIPSLLVCGLLHPGLLPGVRLGLGCKAALAVVDDQDNVEMCNALFAPRQPPSVGDKVVD